MNKAWSIWSSTVTEHINQCILRVPVKNSSKHSWMDGEVRHMHYYLAPGNKHFVLSIGLIIKFCS